MTFTLMSLIFNIQDYLKLSGRVRDLLDYPPRLISVSLMTQSTISFLLKASTNPPESPDRTS